MASRDKSLNEAASNSLFGVARRLFAGAVVVFAAIVLNNIFIDLSDPWKSDAFQILVLAFAAVYGWGAHLHKIYYARLLGMLSNIKTERNIALLKKPSIISEGKDPYAFISYSRKDKDIVYKILEMLYGEKYRLWYDWGIPLSTDWRLTLEKKMRNSSVFLLFVSPNSMTSKEVRAEIAFAQEAGIRIIKISIAETTSGTDIILDNAIEWHNLKYTDFQAKLLEAMNEIAPVCKKESH